MENRDEIIRLILMFCYSAEDVSIHEYVNNNTLSMSKYISFSIDGKVKRMNIHEHHEIKDVFDIDEVHFDGCDGMLVITPTEFILFSVKKVKDALDEWCINHTDDYNIPLSIVNGFLTRINMKENEI